VLAPAEPYAGEAPADAMLVRGRGTMLAVLTATVLGAVMGWLFLFLAAWSSMLNPLGLGAAYAGVAGLVGGFLGAFFGGLLAWWVWPEPPMNALEGMSGPLVALCVLSSAAGGALVGGLLLFVPIWFFTLSVIGIGIRHATIAGVLGALLGAFLGGLLGYRMCRE
jgi:hypothetical protein